MATDAARNLLRDKSFHDHLTVRFLFCAVSADLIFICVVLLAVDEFRAWMTNHGELFEIFDIDTLMMDFRENSGFFFHTGFGEDE